jgi:hypothetical protein
VEKSKNGGLKKSGNALYDPSAMRVIKVKILLGREFIFSQTKKC